MVPFSTLLSSHIRFLLQSLDGSNSDSVFCELCKCTEYGAEGSILLLCTCLEHIDIYGEDLRNIHPDPAIRGLFKYLLEKPNFSTLFCQSVRSEAIRDGFLDNLSDAFCLSVSERIAIGLALLESENDDTQNYGKTFCLSQIEGLTANPSALDSTKQIQQILTFLCQSEDLSKHVDTLNSMLSLVPLEESYPSILNLLTSNEFDEATLLRNLDFLYDGENDFDGAVTETEREVNIAGLMKELSYGCTDDAKKCKYILSFISPLTESTISRIIGTVCCTQGGVLESQNAYQIFLSATGYSPSSDLPVICSWNINLLVDTIKELAPDTNWVGVMEKLDYDRFCIPDEDAFVCLMSIYKLASQDPFPLHSICGSVWNNAEGQLSILKHAVSSPAEVFSFSHSARQVEIIDSIQGLKQSQPSNHAWFCLDLLDVLCQLAEKGYKASVLSILEYPRMNCPEFLLLGMAQIKTTYNLVQNELSMSIFPSILCSNHKNGVIQQIWLCNPLLLMRVVAQALVTDADNITEIVDICNDMKVLDHVLKMIPFAVAIRLAVAAFRKEIVDLEKWLTDNIITYQDTFYEECVKYLKEIQCVTSQQEKIHNSVVSSNIHTQHVAVFLKVLQANSHLIGSSNLCDEMDKLSISLKHGALGQNDGNADASATLTYDNDIEVEANSYFQQMFSEQLTLSEMVQMLSHFKDSSDPREKSIFECVINNLIEEYRFFPKYPEKQLGLAAVLFGSVIKNQLVTHLTLGIAIRYVLDSLRKPADSKMFGFGTKALEQFINRLEEWPQYCNHILQISHLRGTHPELVAYIEGVLTRRSHGGSGPPVDHLGTSTSADNMNELTGSNRGELEHQLSTPLKLQSREHGSLDDANRTSANMSNILKPPLSSTTQSAAMSSSEAEIKKLQSAVTAPSVLSPSPGVARPSRGITSTRFGSALNIETLLFAAERRETPIEAPASEVQDKVSFIINNLSVANIEVKAKEFCEILKEPYYPWFAQYMVMKRASIEPNFHELYLKFLDKANSKDLNKEVVQTTYENCKVLLGSELIKSSSEERSLLKNLGSWLGKLTIGRNQVLRARDIDPKSLIVEAYEKGLMIAVIPFTSKILEPCQSSLAYQPPNPWTMGILALLAEIYAMPNLKMNLKFDIEVLFKNLGVNMKDVTPTSLLKDRVRVVEGNPDFSNKDTAVSHPLVEDKPGKMAAQNQLELPLEVAGSSHLGGAHSRSISPYGASGHSFIEDEKLGEVGFPDQLSAAQGLLPSAASQSPFSNNQLSAIACITQHIVVHPKITAVGLHPHFQSVLPVAMERAINEIVPGIMQRSVSIAIQTTKEIVIKDYALESDESRIYNAAHLMAGSLAGSLAHVTCKEHLRTLLTVQLRNVLQSLNIANELLEPAILNATNDNLDLGCAHLENSAADKAIEMVDAEISQQLTLRRKQSLASSMYDASGLGKGPISVVPETLQPKPGRVSLSQQRVYEDFVRLPWQNQQTSPSTNSMLAGSPAGANLSRPFNLSSVQLNPGVYPSGLGNSVLGAAQPMSLASDEIDMPLPQIFSAASLNPGRNTDVAVQMRPDIDATVRGSSSTPGISELLPVDSSISVKDPVTPSQSLPIPSATERVGTGVLEPLLTTGDALDKYQMVASKLEALLANDGREIEYQSIVSEVPRIILRCITRDEAALAVAQKVFKALYENSSNSFHVGAHLAILAAIRDVSKLVVKELTNWVIYSDEERKFNRDITVGLVRRDLLNLAEYNIHIAKLLDAGRNKAATEFSISLVQTLVSEQPKVLSELHSVVDALDKLASRPGSPESLQQLVEIAKNPSDIGAVSGIIAGMDDKSRQTRDQKAASQTLANRGGYNHIDGFEPDSSRFHEQVSLLFAEWFHICEVPAANVAAASNFTLQLHQLGFLNGDDTSDRFFHVLLELSVSHCLTTEVMSTQQSSLQAQPLSFLAIDIYAKLVFSILKYFPVEQGSSRLFLLPKILAATVRFIQKDADEKQSSFNARPYFRLFIDWLSDIGSLDPIHDGVNLQVLTAFANAFHAVQPLKVPAFSFAWLELVSHRTFMPKLLTGNSQKGWPYLHRLLVALFQFMDPFLRNAELGEAIRFLYKGTLRVLLVLLHDFPEFLCDYHFSFCDVIPPSCIQMRNIVLSAFPRNMRLPDPSTPNLKIDLLVEMSQPPRILTEVEAALKTKQMKADVDEYLKVRQPQGSSLLSELKQKLLLSQNEANHTGTRYNVPLISSLVLYIGIQTIQQLQTRTPSQLQSMSNSALVDAAALDILYFLITELDTEGRYLFLNAIANQLRYPNNHTHYFSFILLHLFLEANQEVIQEQITRVLLERLIVNRPHPWGLLVTFIELIKNPKYSFWNRSFTRCAPEIEKLFESVSRSCGGLKPVNEGLVGSGAH